MEIFLIVVLIVVLFLFWNSIRSLVTACDMQTTKVVVESAYNLKKYADDKGVNASDIAKARALMYELNGSSSKQE